MAKYAGHTYEEFSLTPCCNSLHSEGDFGPYCKVCYHEIDYLELLPALRTPDWSFIPVPAGYKVA